MWQSRTEATEFLPFTHSPAGRPSPFLNSAKALLHDSKIESIAPINLYPHTAETASSNPQNQALRISQDINPIKPGLCLLTISNTETIYIILVTLSMIRYICIVLSNLNISPHLIFTGHSKWLISKKTFLLDWFFSAVSTASFPVHSSSQRSCSGPQLFSAQYLQIGAPGTNFLFIVPSMLYCKH